MVLAGPRWPGEFFRPVAPGAKGREASLWLSSPAAHPLREPVGATPYRNIGSPAPAIGPGAAQRAHGAGTGDVDGAATVALTNKANSIATQAIACRIRKIESISNLANPDLWNFFHEDNSLSGFLAKVGSNKAPPPGGSRKLFPWNAFSTAS